MMAPVAGPLVFAGTTTKSANKSTPEATFEKNFVNNVSTPCSFQASNIVFPVSVNVVVSWTQVNLFLTFTESPLLCFTGMSLVKINTVGSSVALIL